MKIYKEFKKYYSYFCRKRRIWIALAVINIKANFIFIARLFLYLR